MDNRTSDNDEQQSLLEKVNKVLIEFIKNFQNNPFEYFYEEDLRASLQNLLISEINIRIDFPTKIYSKVLGTNYINSSIVKSEYPSFRRFDIAVLGYNDDADFYNQPVNVAIELKLGSHLIYSDKTAGFKSDIMKLKDYLNSHRNERFTGLAIYFCQTEIKKNDIDEWYKDLSRIISSIEVTQLNFDVNKVYALIIPAISINHIYSLHT